MSTLQHNRSEFNSNYTSDNLRGRIKFLILLPIARKNYFLRPVARCGGGS